MSEKTPKARSRAPDYNLGVLNKETEFRGKIGAAWINGDGSISIVLNPCVVLAQSPSVELRLFVNDSKRYSAEVAIPPE